MLEPVLVDTLTKFPQACFVCTGQTGPFIDWMAEKPGGLHLYTCAKCNKTAARVSGFGEGERLDELEDALRTYAERERELTALRIDLKVERDESELKSQSIEQLTGWLEQAQARVTQLEEQRREAAEQLLAGAR